ncbi:MAG: hypothetical protein ACOCV1_00850 [Bacillota bacterium]
MEDLMEITLDEGRKCYINKDMVISIDIDDRKNCIFHMLDKRIICSRMKIEDIIK